MTSRRDNFPHAGLPGLVSFLHVLSVCSSLFSPTQASMTGRIWQTGPMLISRSIVPMGTPSFFFPATSFPYRGPCFRSSFRAFPTAATITPPLCPRSRTDAETESATPWVRRIDHSRRSYSPSIPASGLFCSWDDPRASLEHRSVTCAQESTLAR
jgi:hypothetical protein